MCNLIKLELGASKNYMLKTDDNGDTVELTLENVAIIEAMIQNDSAYLKSYDITAAPKGKYKGSTAFWMTRLSKFLKKETDEYAYDFNTIITEAVTAVDRENNTHLNAEKIPQDSENKEIGRKRISSEITKFGAKKIYKTLKEGKLDLIDVISNKTNGGRINISFASKFCHYACYYLFEGTEHQDNYPIYDNVLRKALPKYLKKYGIINSNKLKDYVGIIDGSNRIVYSKYIEAIDCIIDKAEEQNGERISRNGFDHLLWYYHKGRL